MSRTCKYLTDCHGYRRFLIIHFSTPLYGYINFVSSSDVVLNHCIDYSIRKAS